MSDNGEEEISVEEKLQITQHYLLSSPPGQFNEVLSDIRKIIPAEILPDSLASGIARVSNSKNAKVVVAPTGKKVVLSQAGEINATHYLDPNSGTVFTVDHLTLTTAEAAITPSTEFEAKEVTRNALQTAVSKYITTSYPSEASAGSVYTKDESTFLVAVSGEKTSLKNFWSGRWASTWTVAVSGSSATVAGDIKVHVHYFEDGNLQLQTNKSVPAKALSFDSEADLAQKVVKHIEAQEAALQSGLEDMYSNMSSETFRSMRRTMPITRTKMEWNVNAVRMVKQVRK